jgi:hypothetical protein
VARRQGLKVVNGAYATRGAIGYGKYALVDPNRNTVVYGNFEVGLDEIKAYLKGERADG